MATADIFERKLVALGETLLAKREKSRLYHQDDVLPEEAGSTETAMQLPSKAQTFICSASAPKAPNFSLSCEKGKRALRLNRYCKDLDLEAPKRGSK